MTKKAAQFAFGKMILAAATGVLPVSRFSAGFFKSYGVGDNRIYPFGYFRAKPIVKDVVTTTKREPTIDVIYVGRFVAYKRQEFLIEAMVPLFATHPNLTLTMIGSGELLEKLQSRVRELRLSGRVIFESAMRPEDVPTRIAQADLLALPSDGEGWGMVVNEALSVGVPVVLSDKCGAAELIRDGVNGFIFQNEDIGHLRECLKRFVESRSDWDRLKRNALAVGDKISTEHATKYLVACLRHMDGEVSERPIPPWYSSLRTAEK